MSLKSKRVDSLLHLLYGLVPDGNLKKQVACLYSNHLEGNDYSIHPTDGGFLISLNGISVKFLQHEKAYLFNHGYLKEHTLKPGDVVVDAGAYIGSFALQAAQLVGKSGKVIAFEPEKENYKILLKNISLNKLENIIPVNKGLWSEDTDLRFASSSPGSEGSTISPDGDHVISVVALDSWLKRMSLKKVDFIKMDIEGAEIEAIKGAKNVLRDNNVNLAIASYHMLNGQQTFIELEKMFSSIGYHSETGYPRHLTTYARPGDEAMPNKKDCKIVCRQ